VSDGTRPALRLLLAVSLIAAAYALYLYRKDFIASFFPRGPGGDHGRLERLALPPEPARASAGLSEAKLVRVALLDGVDKETAAALPNYRALCERGLALTVDVGFPTVSLPVQVALWSGRTQQETGVVFRSGRPLVPPLGADAIPAQVAGSIAVAEASPYIVQSLGFADTRPPADGK
jgi:hypothetical protein